MTTLSRDERLVLLIEECSEVIKCATKILRFGWNAQHPNHDVNHVELAKEMGDLTGIIEAMRWEDFSNADVTAFAEQKIIKIARAEACKAKYGRAD